MTAEEFARVLRASGHTEVAKVYERVADLERTLDAIGLWAQKHADEAEDPEESKRFKNILSIIEHGA